MAVELSSDIVRDLEAHSLKGPIPGIVSLMCCRNAKGKIQLITTQSGPMACPECETIHEVTESMLETGYNG